SWRFWLLTRRATCRAPPPRSTVGGRQVKDRRSRCAIAHRGMTRVNFNRPFSIMPVTLDPDAAAVYKAFQEAGRPPYETVSPAEAREFYLQARPVSNPEPPDLKSLQPLAIPPAHGSIPARIYTPLR